MAYTLYIYINTNIHRQQERASNLFQMPKKIRLAKTTTTLRDTMDELSNGGASVLFICECRSVSLFLTKWVTRIGTAQFYAFITMGNTSEVEITFFIT